MKEHVRLPDTELDVMNVLWASPQPMTGAQVTQALAQAHGWAATTVLTLLQRLETKGFVQRQKQGRGYLYSAAVAQQEYLPRESRTILDRLFAGSAKNFMAALNSSDALSRRDIDELQQYLEELKKNL